MKTTLRRSLPLLFGGVLALLLSGCASMQASESDTLDEIKQAMREEPAPVAAAKPPSEVRDALLPAVTLQLPGVEPDKLEPRFDVKVRRAPVRDFFLGLVKGTPYNVVVHPDVSGEVSLDLKNVTVPEVMDVMRDSFGYDYERSGNSFRILPNVLQTRLFQVDYLDVKRSGSSKISAGATQVSKSGSDSGSTGTGGTGGGETSVSSSESSMITTSSESDFWSTLAETLKLIVGSEPGHTVSVNAQSGVIVVRAMPNELRDVKAYLDATQLSAQRQVILEARILEVELADGFQSGINWSSLTSSGSDSLILGQTGGGSLFSGTGLSNISSSAVAMNPPATTSTAGTDTTAFGGMFTMAFSGKNFTAFIELLKTQGNVQVLSSPRIATMNNQKAVIKVGSDEFFVTDVDTSTTAATTTTQTISVELTPFFSGVTLDVTPQISEDGNIILHVRPSVSEVREQTKDVTVTNQTLRMPLAASTIRESDSIIRASNRQIVVIGGLMQNKTRDEQASVPLLGDIPLVGALFRHTRQAKSKSELVILLKPTVVENNRQWSDELRRSAVGYNKFGAQP